jgi:hypothetical protein
MVLKKSNYSSFGINLNGSTTPRFNIYKEVQQGCSLAPFLIEIKPWHTLRDQEKTCLVGPIAIIMGPKDQKLTTNLETLFDLNMETHDTNELLQSLGKLRSSHIDMLGFHLKVPKLHIVN